MRKKQIIFLLLYFFAFVSCKKLPKETHRGRGMMACYINGEKWEAKSKIFKTDWVGSPGGNTDPNPFAKYNTVDNTLQMRGSSKKNGQGAIYINIIDLLR